MLREKPRRRIRCPHCGVMRAALSRRWCGDCERQGDLPFRVEFTTRPAPPIEVKSTASMMAEAFRRSTSAPSGLITATGDVEGGGAVWGALLRVDGEVVWRCKHLHRTSEGVFACASRERARREPRPCRRTDPTASAAPARV